MRPFLYSLILVILGSTGSVQAQTSQGDSLSQLLRSRSTGVGDVRGFARIQQVLLPQAIGRAARVERQPLTNAFDLIVPSAGSALIFRLRRQVKEMIKRVQEVPGPGRAKRYRFHVVSHNFKVWLKWAANRPVLYIGQERGGTGGGVTVPLIPYYVDVEIPEMLIGEPTYVIMDPRDVGDSALRVPLPPEATDEDVSARNNRAIRLTQAARNFNAALEFFDLESIEPGQLKKMLGDARNAVNGFFDHPLKELASHLLSEILYDESGMTGQWGATINLLTRITLNAPMGGDAEQLFRYQRALYRLGRAESERAMGQDLRAAAGHFKMAGRQWREDLGKRLQKHLDSNPNDEYLRSVGEASQELADAAEVAELETQVRLGEGADTESNQRDFMTREGALMNTARYRLGSMLYADHVYSMAAPMLVKAFEENPDRAKEQPAMGILVAESLRILKKDKPADRLLSHHLEVYRKVKAQAEKDKTSLILEPSESNAIALAMLRRGDFAWQKGDADGALKFYRDALRLFPKLEAGRLARIRTLEVTGESVQGEAFPLEAYRTLQRRMSRASEAAAEESMYRESRARFLRGEYREAYERLLFLEEEFPESFMLKHDLGLIHRARLALMKDLWSEGRHPEIIENFVLADDRLDASPGGMQTLLIAGKSMNMVGMHRRAIKILQRALQTRTAKEQPDDEEEIMVALAKAYLGRRDYFRAAEVIEYHLATYPKGKQIANLWVVRGEIEEAKKRSDRAIESYRTAISKTKQPLYKARLYQRIGRLEAKRDAPASAAVAFNKAIESFQTVQGDQESQALIDIRFELGDAYYRLRNWRLAAQAYDRARVQAEKTDERGAMAGYRIAEVRAILGDLAGALQEWKSLANADDGLWNKLSAAAAEDLTWRLRHDALLNNQGGLQ